MHKDVVSVDEKVLVHQGLLPLSQAILKVAMSCGKIVYTTYRTESEKQSIMEMFPEVGWQ